MSIKYPLRYSMKMVAVIAGLVGSLQWSAQAAVYSLGNVSGSGSALSLTIPDSTFPAGITSTINVSGEYDRLDSVVITLNISGGWNGDLYGYLSHNGQSVTLLNRVGSGAGDAIQSEYGYSTAGFNNITLSSLGTYDNIHDVSSPNPGGTYAPDSGSGSLVNFNGGPANGNWTLFLADASGGNVSTLQGWSLEMTSSVPEPVNMALGAFGVLLLGGGGIRWYRQSSRAQADADKAQETV
jgi:hypothetical protein